MSETDDEELRLTPLTLTLELTMDLPEDLHDAVRMYEGRNFYETVVSQVLRDYIRGLLGQIVYGGEVAPDPPQESDSVHNLLLRAAMLVGVEDGKEQLKILGVPGGIFTEPGDRS
jgi:hypothetical protein